MVTPEQVAQARQEAADSEEFVDAVDILKKKGIVQEQELLAMLAQQYGMELLDLSHYDIPQEVIDSMSGDIALHYRVVPVMKHDNLLTIAMSDPTDMETLDTLRYLQENFGSQMELSVLMGSDQIARLDGWKEYDRILEYPVYVYPRRGGESVSGFEGRITLLDGAPLLDIASTEIRDRIARGEDVSTMLDPKVIEYIRKKGLWSPATRIAALTGQLAEHPDDIDLLLERGKLHYRLSEWGPALNDFNAVLRIDAGHVEARQFAQMVQEIFEFRYKDIYNP